MASLIGNVHTHTNTHTFTHACTQRHAANTNKHLYTKRHTSASKKYILLEYASINGQNKKKARNYSQNTISLVHPGHTPEKKSWNSNARISEPCVPLPIILTETAEADIIFQTISHKCPSLIEPKQHLWHSDDWIMKTHNLHGNAVHHFWGIF